MKKSFLLIVVLNLLSSAPVLAMEAQGMLLILTTVSNWIAAHPEVGRELGNNSMHVTTKPLLTNEFPHQPQQQYRVKKTQQPHTPARRQFNTHHK